MVNTRRSSTTLASGECPSPFPSSSIPPPTRPKLRGTRGFKNLKRSPKDKAETTASPTASAPRRTEEDSTAVVPTTRNAGSADDAVAQKDQGGDKPGVVEGGTSKRRKKSEQQQHAGPWARLISQSSRFPHLYIGPHDFSVGYKKSCNLCLKELPAVSKLLCKLRRLEQGQCKLKVYGNKGFVLVNGRPIFPGTEVPLIGGDEVTFGLNCEQAYIFQDIPSTYLKMVPPSVVTDMENRVCEEPIKLSYALLQFVTCDFSQMIGSGGFGIVYMGVYQKKKIAVKKLLQTGSFSEKQFEDELKVLRRVKHKNIVRFLGYCSDKQEKVVEHNGRFVIAEEWRRFLCFEYVPNKSLHDYLKDESHGHEWDICYQLFDGICQGLCYLHNEERITHLDLKPQNILLDVDMVPKITDFGLSRLFSVERSKAITKNIRGSWGYIAPEYWSKGEISFKSDIFSLGVILKKLLGGNNDSSNPENWHQSLDIKNPQVNRCIKIAQLCMDDDPRKRPTIDCIINMLSENKATPYV